MKLISWLMFLSASIFSLLTITSCSEDEVFDPFPNECKGDEIDDIIGSWEICELDGSPVF